jgi:hypothetical protein
VALPSVLRDDFNENLQQETWPEVYGVERGTLSGEPLKSGTALIFKGVRRGGGGRREHPNIHTSITRELRDRMRKELHQQQDFTSEEFAGVYGWRNTRCKKV